MKDKRKTHKRIVIACGIIAVIFIFIFNMPFFSCSLKHTFFSVMNLPTNRQRARLLIKTDYHELLAACREVMKREDLVPGRAYNASRLELPKVIRKLGPSAIRKNDNFLNVYIRGFMDRFGVYAYPQDFEVPYKGFEYRDKELIPGLWYVLRRRLQS